ncbi:RNA polymerase sigma factor region1.1 domain-containing protein [Microvirga vignae]|uniref:RNA polymerase sigma factor region1.1 domain-containing protein n=1 Tax=Microvirga vignae TaxID=1225564 RepID=UPI00069CBC80|nr:RNA polymerase sigma factor region1.1 domain-containing protein [Microvirga vignae]
MQPALDSNTLDRLISLGRERGHLTTEDLRASLPIESMSAEEIALVVVHLEETGVPVELEESLLLPDPKPVAMPRQSAEIIPFPGPRASRKPSKAKPLQPAKPALPEPRQAETQETSFSPWIVAAAGMLAFAVFALIIFATAG